MLKDVKSVSFDPDKLIKMEYYSLKSYDTIFDEESRELSIKDQVLLDVNTMKSLTGLDQDIYAIYLLYTIPYLNTCAFSRSKNLPVFTIRENLTLNLHRA